MIERTALDLVALPTALLTVAKGHCRVEHTRDDAMLTTVYIPGAIRTVEAKCNVSLNPATYVMTPDELRFGCGFKPGWRLPVNNVHAFTVDDAGLDVSADYTLGNQDLGGNANSYLYPAGDPIRLLSRTAMVEVEVGTADPAALAPAFLSLILRLTASAYENREASAELWADAFADELMTMWRPCA